MKRMMETDKLLVRIGTARDAISRKTEQTSLDYMIDGVLMNCSVLLKEQDSVEPIAYHRSDGTIFKYECRRCRTKIFKNDLFCRHCGQAVKWE